MGKKGGKGKQKPIVMTQQEFFTSQQQASNQGKEADWGKGDLFGTAPKGKVVVATGKPVELFPPTENEAPPKEEVKKEEKVVKAPVQEPPKPLVKQEPAI